MKAITISAPSGCGKTTVINKLISYFPNFERVISFTTRKPRQNEVNNIDYYFVDEPIDSNICLEIEEVYTGTFYGIFNSELERIISNNKIPIFIIDTHGALKLKEKFKDDLLTIFLLPPNKPELIKRLENRNTESSESIRKRISKIDTEITEGINLDYYIINEEVNKTVAEVKYRIDKFLNPEPKLPIVINLFGTSGSGKSTTASRIFSCLKMEKFKTEQVYEYAKELVYENNYTSLSNQIKVFGEQHHRQFRLNNHVDVMITDSPLLLSCVYCPIELQPYLSPLVFHEFNKYNNINFLLERDFEYESYGRTQNEEESDIIGKKVVDLLDSNNIEYTRFKYPVDDNIHILVELIEKELERRENGLN